MKPCWILQLILTPSWLNERPQTMKHRIELPTEASSTHRISNKSLVFLATAFWVGLLHTIDNWKKILRLISCLCSYLTESAIVIFLEVGYSMHPEETESILEE